MTGSDDRIAALEARVAALEAAIGGDPDGTPAAAEGGRPDRHDPAGAGVLRYGGDVTLNGEVRWNITYSAAATAALSAERVSAVLGALGHPVRLAVVRELLHRPLTAAELTERLDAESTGRLYHHLGTLSAAGVVVKAARNTYAVAPERVVPLLVAMLAAGDIADLLR
ncbi:helix-turn-helix domain-containing protein [Tsukamurella sp. 8F]|uniref:ArsR/SmtB family transcription factor n=1 Tax=unclassified Tsukamurella TaxID=2633480 RepID=UPI0023B98C3A|nr:MULTISPECIES: helix-turn-helix domain-containing protein [unclassified Tsukamurella]MDF0528346.1 helix-turn-helix domain-containing protein [Tsukamurella sp. 8J]MDF0586171.1 helix-turn-helix domain-containing protein [Tsukamurella sp. 8F]